MPDVVAKIIEHIPAGDYKVLLETLVNKLILGDWDDWPELLDTITELAIDQALNEIQAKITDELLSKITGSSEVAELLREILTEFGNNGFDGIQSPLENLDTKLDSLISQYGTKENLLLAIDEVFDQLNDQLDVGPIRDFLLPMIRMIVRSAILKGEIDNDAVIDALTYHFAQQLILKPYFSEPMNDYLEDALQKAKTFVPGPGDGYDRFVIMGSAFGELRTDIMDSIQEESWNALSRQSPIDDFTQILTHVIDLLNEVGVVFRAFCVSYPMLCPVADDIESLVATLDAVELMTKVLELSLKAADLTNLQSAVEPINNTVMVE